MADRRGSARHSRRLRLAGFAVAALVLAGCSDLGGAAPKPTPLDFGGIAGQLSMQGLTVEHVVSGDAGCSDSRLIPTAIGFDVSGLGVTAPLRAHLFIFSDRSAYDRRRADVDVCAAAWATDIANVEFIDAPPFVLVVQGPLPADFKAALVRAITTSAGTGG